MLKKPLLVGISLVGAGIILIALLVGLSGKSEKTVEPLDPAPEPEPVYLFEIPVDSFRQEQVVISPNQFLADLLLPRGISYATIDQLARQSKSVFNVTDMKAGNRCHFFYTRDSLRELRHLVYEIDQARYVVYAFGDSLLIRKGTREVVARKAHVSGVIESSMWNAMVDNGISTNLALELSDIYAWTINFFTLQKGDGFTVIHDNRYVDSTYIGIGEVYATKMRYANRDHYAFLFEQNGKRSYYDEEGNSLRRSFLKAPLTYRRISSRYTNRRFHPILRIYRPHRGVDYAAQAGTPVQSIGDGRVIAVAYDRASGNYIKIKHNSVYTSGYIHLQRRPNYNVGDYVKQGNVIGRVGMTGYATGPHLDFRIWKNGTPVDPLKVESPPVEPVLDVLRPQFDSLVRVYMHQLENGLVFIGP